MRSASPTPHQIRSASGSTWHAECVEKPTISGSYVAFHVEAELKAERLSEMEDLGSMHSKVNCGVARGSNVAPFISLLQRRSIILRKPTRGMLSMVTRSTLLSPVRIVSVTGAAIAEDDETDARVACTTGYDKFCSDVFQSGGAEHNEVPGIEHGQAGHDLQSVYGTARQKELSAHDHVYPSIFESGLTGLSSASDAASSRRR